MSAISRKRVEEIKQRWETTLLYGDEAGQDAADIRDLLTALSSETEARQAAEKTMADIREDMAKDRRALEVCRSDLKAKTIGFNWWKERATAAEARLRAELAKAREECATARGAGYAEGVEKAAKAAAEAKPEPADLTQGDHRRYHTSGQIFGIDRAIAAIRALAGRADGVSEG